MPTDRIEDNNEIITLQQYYNNKDEINLNNNIVSQSSNTNLETMNLEDKDQTDDHLNLNLLTNNLQIIINQDKIVDDYDINKNIENKDIIINNNDKYLDQLNQSKINQTINEDFLNLTESKQVTDLIKIDVSNEPQNTQYSSSLNNISLTSNQIDKIDTNDKMADETNLISNNSN